MNTDSAYAPYEQAMMDFFRGEKNNTITFIRDDGFETNIPVEYLYGIPDSFSQIDTTALTLCKGRVLDVGAGSGDHSLFLQQKNLEVYALEISPTLVKILKLRGLKHIIESDILKLENVKFNTIIMLGNGLGIAQDISGLEKLLFKLKKLLVQDGSVLCDSLDVRKTDIPENLEYHQRNVRMGKYRGEVQFRFRYKNMEGPLLKWLHVDFQTLAAIAEKNNLYCKLELDDNNGNYLAQLQLK